MSDTAVVQVPVTAATVMLPVPVAAAVVVTFIDVVVLVPVMPDGNVHM